MILPASCRPLALAGRSCEVGAVTKASQAGRIKSICKHVKRSVSNDRKGQFLFIRVGVVILMSVWT